jgi:cell wall-associated NlpC family hydrolase
VTAQRATTSSVAKPVVKPSLGARVVRIAMAQRGKRYASGSSGPRAFDCSGLVRYSYRIAGVSRRIGGGHSARGMYTWARMHGLTSRSNPQIGDIAIYGNGTHAAIYIGHGRVVSALNRRVGIRVTSLHALTAPFTTFIHTHI